VAAKKEVNEPSSIKINSELGNISNIKENFIKKKTPAVTMVAACIKAETGVGPSIASGSQLWSPNCPDLLVAAIIRRIPTSQQNISPV